MITLTSILILFNKYSLDKACNYTTFKGSPNQLDIFENIITAIKTCQYHYEREVATYRKFKLTGLKNEIKALHKINKPSKKIKKRIAHISNNLDEIYKEKIRYLAMKHKIDYSLYGNSATKYYLAREKNRTQREIIKTMTIDGSECNNPIDIGKHIYNSYNSIFNQNDPYKHGDIQEFLGTEGLSKLGKIKSNIAEMLESSFTLAEVTAAINNLGKMKNGGPDKVTSELIKFIFRLCPTLIHHVCVNISNGETGLASDFLKRYIIFIRKPNSTKTNIKML